MKNNAKKTGKTEKLAQAVTLELQQLIDDGLIILLEADSIPDTPLRCSGKLEPWDELQRGKITSEIEMAYHYYMNLGNGGTLEERRAKLNQKVKETFSKFFTDRKKEYESVRCKYRKEMKANRGHYKWATLKCQPEFQFKKESLKRTQNGNWKEGPIWKNNFTEMTWKTGGHRTSKTFAELDAGYLDINKRVIDELNSARKVLFDRGIPTELPTNIERFLNK